MSARYVLAACVSLLAACVQCAAFANDGYAPVLEGTPVSLPTDFAPHPDHRLEWWYVTANLKGEDGQDYGIQWTLFRTALWPREDTGEPDDPGRQIWFAHAAATSASHHHASERWVRGDMKLAGVEGKTARIDNWSFSPFSGGHIRAETRDFRYDLSVTEEGPQVLHGTQGYSEKAASGQASHYVSMPRISVSGSLTLEGEAIPVTGEAWMDREWSSDLLSRTQTGWDWFALSLSDDRKLMVFRVRGTEPKAHYYAGTLIAADNQVTTLGAGDISLTPVARSRYGNGEIPTQWRVAIASLGLDVMVSALNPVSEMPLTIPYWEGPVAFTGSHSGTGYLEMTGYARE